jgi:hypothetical protein
MAGRSMRRPELSPNPEKERHGRKLNNFFSQIDRMTMRWDGMDGTAVDAIGSKQAEQESPGC